MKASHTESSIPCSRCSGRGPHVSEEEILQLRIAFDLLDPATALQRCREALAVVFGDALPPHDDGVVSFSFDDCSCHQLRLLWDIVRPRNTTRTFREKLVASMLWTSKERRYLEAEQARLHAMDLTAASLPLDGAGE